MHDQDGSDCPYEVRIGRLTAERDRHRDALERIAHQGLGTFDFEQHRLVGSTGEPWAHWAEIARIALQTASTEGDTHG